MLVTARRRQGSPWRHLGPLALAALIAGAAGCKKKPDDAAAPAATTPDDAAAPAVDDRPEIGVLTQVIFKTADPDEERELYAAELAKQLGRQLAASELFVAPPDEPPASHRARPVEVEVLVSYDLVEGARHGGASLVATVEASLRWIDGAADLPVRENVLLERPLEPGDRARLDALFPEHVDRAVSAAGRGLLAKEALRRGTDAEIVSSLSSDDPHLVAWALELAGHRRIAEAVPAAIEALGQEDELVRGAALTALVALRDPRAVAPLTDDVDFKDYDQVRQRIEAVSAIGGADAAAFLEFVASGHPDTEIRARAAEALARVKENP